MTFLSARKLGQADAGPLRPGHPALPEPVDVNAFLAELFDTQDLETSAEQINNAYQFLWRTQRCMGMPLTDPLAVVLDKAMIRWVNVDKPAFDDAFPRRHALPGYGSLYGTDWRAVLNGHIETIAEITRQTQARGGFERCYSPYAPYIPQRPEAGAWWLKPAIGVTLLVGVGYFVGKGASFVRAFR